MWERFSLEPVKRCRSAAGFDQSRAFLLGMEVEQEVVVLGYVKGVVSPWERWILEDRGYCCGRCLGQGAFSKVYCVEKRADGLLAACKISSDLELLKREAKIMETLQHPLFPRYYGMWQKDGIGFLLMEYVPGSNLEEMNIRRDGFGLRQAIYIGMELAEGLRYLHERRERLLFRDVKPANAMIRQDGRVKLLDLGCICAMDGEVLSRAGTPGFAAPEQLGGAVRLTAACDVYGWARTMMTLLGTDGKRGGAYDLRWKRMGRTAMGKSIADGGQKGETGRGRRIGKENYGTKMGVELWRFLERCTDPEPSRRIPDMREILDVLAKLGEWDKKGKTARANASLDMEYQKNIVLISKKT